MKTKATPFNDKAKLAPYTKLFKVTKEGGRANGLSDEMPPFSDLTAAQVNDIIAYIHTLAK